MKTNYNPQDNQSDETFLKFWAEAIQKQQRFNKQLNEKEKIYNIQVAENFRKIQEKERMHNIQLTENLRQINESEKKFLDIWGEIVKLVTGKPK